MIVLIGHLWIAFENRLMIHSLSLSDEQVPTANGLLRGNCFRTEPMESAWTREVSHLFIGHWFPWLVIPYHNVPLVAVVHDLLEFGLLDRVDCCLLVDNLLMRVVLAFLTGFPWKIRVCFL